MVILYPAALLNSFIRSSRFFVESLVFSILSIMSSEYTDNVTSFLSNLDTFYFFSFFGLIAVAMTSNTVLNRTGENGHTVLNRTGENGHPCLVPDFSQKAFSFSPLSIILVVSVS